MIIAMWSGPRNLSTAMMRSFGSRADCSVIDEPFFAPYLAVSGKAHPGRDETLAGHETDPEAVQRFCLAPTTTAYSFQKHMPQQMLEGFPMCWAKEAKHFFLIREPARVIASYVRARAEFEIEDLGVLAQRRLWENLGRPPVIDSTDILRDPAQMLEKLCRAIDIPWDSDMLSWEAGLRPEDGAWAPFWYHSVHNSTGFGPAPQSAVKLNDIYTPYLEKLMPEFEILFRNRIT